MATVQSSRPRVKPTRTCHLIDIGGGRQVLAITEWLKTTAHETKYHLKPIPADFGTAFELTKFSTDGGDTYHVHFDRTLGHSCTCLGFLHHGMCKDGRGCRHIAALAELLGRGLL
jgi:hypothetical protein